MMKKMKRIVAVLLAGVMALTMLTACGGGSGSGGGNDFIDRSSRIEEALNAQMASSGTPFNNTDINALIEATAQKISEKPGEYYASLLAFNDDRQHPDAALYVNLLSSMASDVNKILNVSSEETLITILSFFDGSMTEDDIIGVMNQASTFSTSSSDYTYCIRVYHITNPANANDNLWAIFAIRRSPKLS